MIVASTDGSTLASGRGPSGWAWYIDEDNWDAGGVRHGTAQQAELLAVLNLLLVTPQFVPLHVLSDSTYVIKACTKWRFNWRKSDWKTTSNKKVANLSIVKQLDEVLDGRPVTFEWVRGHSGHPMNETADMLCGQAAMSAKQGEWARRLGPGFSTL